MSGQGGRGSGLYHLLRLTARALVFLLILAVGTVVFLHTRINTEGFRNKFQNSIVSELGAEEGKLEGFKRLQGKIVMGRFAARAEKGTFFTDLDLQDLNCRMGVFDGLFRVWKPGPISIARLDINLRAGTGDPADAERLGEALFKNRPKLDLSSLDVHDATVSWGYSESTRGLIRGSHMIAKKRASDWWFQFTGGTFSQNWLKDLQIEELEVLCGAEGLVIQKGVLRKGNGFVDLSDVRVRGKERPELSGIVKVRNLPLEGLLPAGVESLMEGFISGSLRVSGSTNSQEGIGFEGMIKLAEGDGIMVRDRIPLLKSLRSVDVFNNYRRVNFQTGSFHLKTGGGRMVVSEIDLAAGELMTLKGGFLVRHPTKEEKALSADLLTSQGNAEGQDEGVKEIDFTLRRAGSEARKKEPKETGLMGRYEIRVEERKFAERIAASIAEMLRYEGELAVTLRPDAFDQSPSLQEKYPKANPLGRIEIKIPLDGPLGSLTLRQAEEISNNSK